MDNLPMWSHLSFSFFGFVKFVKCFEILVFLLNKYKYEICICGNICKYNTSVEDINITVQITTCIK